MKHGWNEQSVQTLFFGTQEDPERMLCMTPWVPGYKGDSALSCGSTLSLNKYFQNLMKDHFEHAGEVLQVKEVLPNFSAWRPPRMSNSTKDNGRRLTRGTRKWAHLAPARVLSYSLIGALFMLAGGVAYKKFAPVSDRIK